MMPAQLDKKKQKKHLEHAVGQVTRCPNRAMAVESATLVT